jgi:F-type H+-transporting ATPase subunit b
MLAIPPDYSFLVQIVSFFILWMGLKRLIWDPMVEVLEQREARTRGARQEAEELRATADTSAAEYERQVQEARSALNGESQTARASVEAEQHEIVSRARDQSSAQLAELRANLSRQIATARAAIPTEAQVLARDMVQRVVGRSL